MVKPSDTNFGISVDSLTQSFIDRLVWLCLGMLVVSVVSGLLVRGMLMQLNHDIRKDNGIWQPIIERFRS